MKNLYLIATFLFLSDNISFAQQNLVPNGDFEDYYGCPTSTSQADSCVGWRSWTGGTSDYFNICAVPGSFVSVPANTFGYQYPHSGNAYMGGFSSFHIGSNSKEYITRQIVELQQNAFYDVSISVSRSDKSVYGTNDFGIYFYKDGPTYYSSQSSRANVIPQVQWPDVIITDTQNWVRLEQMLFADSAYKHISIGGFGDISTGGKAYPPGIFGLMYYYFDSVVVKLHDTIYMDIKKTALCVGERVPISYYCFPERRNGNVFTIQLSDALGNFNSPVNIGVLTSDTSGLITVTIPENTVPGTKYKLRLLSSDYADTSIANVDLAIAGNVKDFHTRIGTPVCVGKHLLLRTRSSSPGVKFKWHGPNGFYSEDTTISFPAKFSDSGEYSVSANLDGCVTTVSFNVEVKPLPEKLTVSTNAPVCAGSTLLLQASSATADVIYNWQGPKGYIQNTEIINATVDMSGKYEVTAYRDDCTVTDSIFVQVKPFPSIVKPTGTEMLWEGEDVFLNVDTSTSGATYRWSGPNGFSSDNRSNVIPTASPAATGWYVVHIDLDGCGFSDSTLVVVKEIPGGDGLVLYPNPNNGSFMISGDVHTNEYLLLTITNILEQELYREGVQPVNNHIRHAIDAGELAAGVYLLNVMTAKKILRIKFVVL